MENRFHKAGNRDHPIPDNYQVPLLQLSNGREVDERIYPDLQAMFDEARRQGMGLFVREGYRTYEDQQRLLDEKIEACLTEGYSRIEAEQEALRWVAKPGTSEHQLGLAVDINADFSISTSDEVYTWLENHSYEYGFIKRYPSDKIDITGISNEPWHFRYVGQEAAREIYQRGICLEEYLQ